MTFVRAGTNGIIENLAVLADGTPVSQGMTLLTMQYPIWLVLQYN